MSLNAETEQQVLQDLFTNTFRAHVRPFAEELRRRIPAVEMGIEGVVRPYVNAVRGKALPSQAADLLARMDGFFGIVPEARRTLAAYDSLNWETVRRIDTATHLSVSLQSALASLDFEDRFMDLKRDIEKYL